MIDARPPTDIELAQMKRVCAALAKAVDDVDFAVGLAAVEIFVATLLVETDTVVDEFAGGLRPLVDRMKAARPT